MADYHDMAIAEGISREDYAEFERQMEYEDQLRWEAHVNEQHQYERWYSDVGWIMEVLFRETPDEAYSIFMQQFNLHMPVLIME